MKIQYLGFIPAVIFLIGLHINLWIKRERWDDDFITYLSVPVLFALWLVIMGIGFLWGVSAL